jgi:hypothetical protein
MKLPFTEQECTDAFSEWGCNCGPLALAAVLGKKPVEIRPAFDAIGFSAKRYTSPAMMQAALRFLRVPWHPKKIEGTILEAMKFPDGGLVRIQWEGPWTAPGANPKWAYRQTHWVASWRFYGATAADAVCALLDPVLFDVNGGLMTLEEWEKNIVPWITGNIPGADGDWHVTHSWEIREARP